MNFYLIKQAHINYCIRKIKADTMKNQIYISKSRDKPLVSGVID